MTRRRNLGYSLAAALLALLLVYGVYLILIRQVELQQTVRIVAPKDFIPAGTRLEAEMLELVAVVKSGVRSGTLETMEAAVGKWTLVPLGTHEPVLDWKIDRFSLLPAPGQATFPIPKEYVLSIPGGIRAGDQVAIYASGKSGTVRLLEEAVTVASVKSSANTEVDDPKAPSIIAKVNGDKEKLYLSRRDANGRAEQLNLNLSEDQWRLIDEACGAKQNKLVIAFLSASKPEEEGGNIP
ncbi:SAF domain-containing protein [Paenibacillus sp. YN15]|uniref:SAF domain-containing protein n=1 Tax=Paenibacillus sp. YN15 TaxID=1742774 RepID=UPI000DCB1750|nr:SAF domain-containing protein [Paenibacillus sp. YN15]RAU95080.1 flagellar biosynthesis protein FlgA [Paenibacillus sp. YN15]